MKLVVALALSLASSVAAAGPCMEAPITPHVAMPATGAIPSDGGIVVMHRMQAADEPAYGPIANWKFANGKPVKRIAIAPGLELIEAADTVLLDGNGRQVARALLGKAAGTPEAPSVAKIDHGWSSAGQRIVSTVVVELRAPATGFVVAYDKTGTQVRSFGVIYDRHATIYSSGGCTEYANGTQPSVGGDEVRIAVLDASGRLSKQTAPIKIGANRSQRPL